MQRRKLGRTGLDISELVFGGGWVGGILIDADDDTRRRAIRMALDGGINWIDTAASYGDGKSETALGWLLNEIDDKPYLSTKFRVRGERLHDIPGQIRESVEASLGRLRRDRVDLLQLHNPVGLETTDTQLHIDEVLKPGGVADTLAALRDEGITDYVGFTAFGDTECCRRLAESGRFDTAQVYYNLLNPSAGRKVPAGWRAHDFGCLIETCHAAGVGVLNIRVLAAGVIATEVRHGRESPMYSRGSDMASEEARARTVVEALDGWPGTRAQAAIRFALDNPHVSGVLVGLAKLEHLDEAIAASKLPPLSAEIMARLDKLYDSVF
jgi:aryl-alcohol dehydrogenase-like predicted oxidoreductase